MLDDGVAVDVVHHCLEGRWGIGETEEHDSRFIEPSVCFEGSLPLVPFLDLYIVIPPSDIQLRIDVCSPQVVYKCRDEGEWVLVTHSPFVNRPVVLYQAQLV